MISRDTRIDRATQTAFGRLILHGNASPADAPFALETAVLFLLFRRSAPTSAAGAFPCRSPKKRWPFQSVPVIALAIWDRLPKVWPSSVARIFGRAAANDPVIKVEDIKIGWSTDVGRLSNGVRGVHRV
jgi:hypothetical protein